MAELVGRTHGMREHSEAGRCKGCLVERSPCESLQRSQTRIAVLSLWLTPDEHREANGFSWEPIREVAILFAAIFVCAIPVLAALAAGERGPFAWLLHVVNQPDGEDTEQPRQLGGQIPGPWPPATVDTSGLGRCVVEAELLSCFSSR